MVATATILKRSIPASLLQSGGNNALDDIAHDPRAAACMPLHNDAGAGAGGETTTLSPGDARANRACISKGHQKDHPGNRCSIPAVAQIGAEGRRNRYA